MAQTPIQQQEKQAERAALALRPDAARRRANAGTGPTIPEAEKDSRQGTPAEPIQRWQGQVLKNLRFGTGVHLLHEVGH